MSQPRAPRQLVFLEATRAANAFDTSAYPSGLQAHVSKADYATIMDTFNAAIGKSATKTSFLRTLCAGVSMVGAAICVVSFLWSEMLRPMRAIDIAEATRWDLRTLHSLGFSVASALALVDMSAVVVLILTVVGVASYLLVGASAYKFTAEELAALAPAVEKVNAEYAQRNPPCEWTLVPERHMVVVELLSSTARPAAVTSKTPAKPALSSTATPAETTSDESEPLDDAADSDSPRSLSSSSKIARRITRRRAD